MPKNFNVSIKVDITGDGMTFSNYQLAYSNLSYEGLQALQHALTDALLALGDAKLTAEKKSV